MIGMTEKIKITKNNIYKAIEDYWAHSSMGSYIKEAVSDTFVQRLAEDSVRAKENLRNVLRKSPQWNEELDAIVINGNSSHDPNYNTIQDLAMEILMPALEKADEERTNDILNAIFFFAYPDDTEKDTYIQSIKKIDRRAYAPGKKLSRVFKAICVALGVADETPGSDFQRKFAQIADEMFTRQIGFKLFLSINPAHFLTMSNPKRDDRGSCLTSCHSFNCDDYEYNNGCTGYARDGVTMIAFTAADPDDPATFNNRKTSRQLFMYEPDSALLLQSRMYNTHGGTTGAQEESKLYRDLVERQLAMCEGAPNYWHSCCYYHNKYNIKFSVNDDFGGYKDWNYEEYAAVLCIRKDRLTNYHVYEIGTSGLCVHCGEEISDGLLCECRACQSVVPNRVECENCGYYYDEDDMHMVYDEDGYERYVCDDCYEDYDECYECECDYQNYNLYTVYNRYGDEVYVCPSCRYSYYEECKICGKYHHRDDMEDGICSSCREGLRNHAA